MSDTMFALADTRTVNAFLLVGELRRRVNTARVWQDAVKDTWLGVTNQQTWVGIADAGPGAIYHPATSTEVAKTLRVRPQSKLPQSEGFTAPFDGLRLGSRITRLLWCVHLGVIEQRVSAPEFGYAHLAARVWGREQTAWPHHWRRDLRELLFSLTWLHRAEDVANDQPLFGPDTVVVYQVEIDGKRLTGMGGHDSRDARIRVFVGPALLGTLERLARTESSGLRTYDAIRSMKALKEIGKLGRLQRVFLPALFPERAGLELAPSRQQLLQALVRETTRARQAGRNRAPTGSEPEVVTGGVVRDYSGRVVIPCSTLRGGLGYVGFNGNGGRRGMGSRLVSTGWLARCGYAANEAANFLADLRVLADDLGLVVVGVTRDGVVELDTLAAWASARATAQRLATTDVRVFVAEGYEARWAAHFGWPATPVPDRADSDRLRLVELVAATGLTMREIARQVGFDHSYLSRILAGKKSCPAGLVEQVGVLVARSTQSRDRTDVAYRGRPRRDR